MVLPEYDLEVWSIGTEMRDDLVNEGSKESDEDLQSGARHRSILIGAAKSVGVAGAGLIAGSELAEFLDLAHRDGVLFSVAVGLLALLLRLVDK